LWEKFLTLIKREVLDAYKKEKLLPLIKKVNGVSGVYKKGK
jgi:hypothetical protein